MRLATMNRVTAVLVALGHRLRCGARRVRLGEAGEGVISTAIAVLVIAFLGVAMWVGFSSIFDTAEDKVKNQVEQIGG